MSAGEMLNERETLGGVMSMLAAFQLEDGSGDEEDEDLLLLATAKVALLEDARIDRTVIKPARGADLLLASSTGLQRGPTFGAGKKKKNRTFFHQNSIAIKRKRIYPKLSSLPQGRFHEEPYTSSSAEVTLTG